MKAFLSLAPDGDEWSTLSSGCPIPREGTRYAHCLEAWLWSGSSGKEKYLLPLSQIVPRYPFLSLMFLYRLNYPVQCRVRDQLKCLTMGLLPLQFQMFSLQYNCVISVKRPRHPQTLIRQMSCVAVKTRHFFFFRNEFTRLSFVYNLHYSQEFPLFSFLLWMSFLWLRNSLCAEWKLPADVDCIIWRACEV
jgi:hypothetical protein